jgi:type II secretion system protein N
MAFQLPQLGRKTRMAIRIVGFFLLAVVTFVFALQLTFPYGRVKDKVVEALSAKYDVTIGGVERGIIPGRVYFTAVSLRTRPAKADETASTLYIEKLEVDLGILALIKGAAKVRIDAKIATGHLKGTIEISKAGTFVDMEGVDLPAANLPMKEAIGLPMSGKLELSVQLDLPNEKNKAGKSAPDWTKASGEINFECPSGCTFGDGKTKLKPKLKNARSQAFAGDGIDFGKINVDTMLAKVTIKDSQLELAKFDAKSQDGELHVDYQMTLAQEFGDSGVMGCLRFKGSDALAKREPKTYAALTTTGASIGPDGLFHIKLDGKFKEMKRLAQFCGPSMKSAMDDPGAAGNSRPNLTVQPPDDTLRGKTPEVPINPPPPPPPVPADAAVAPPTPMPPNGEAVGSGGSAGSSTANPPGAEVPETNKREVPEGKGTAGAGGAGSDVQH